MTSRRLAARPPAQLRIALARTERKSGRGYKGFTIYAAPDVTLEQDLERRDLTINAIARDESGRLIDPFGGARDLKEGVLRHVSDAFHDDPVRILRVARFAARFGFRIDEGTMALMKSMVDTGEADHLVPERVWQEFSRGLGEDQAELMFDALERCDFRPKLLPELKAIPKGFSGPLPVRFALLCWPVPEADIRALCERLKVPNEERELALLACRGQMLLGASTPGELLALFKRADAFRRPERFGAFLEVARLARPGFNSEKIRRALKAAAAVDAGEIASRASAPAAISALLDQAREQAIAAGLAA